MSPDEVFLVMAGDGRHGINPVGVHRTEAEAIAAIPEYIESLVKCFGGGPVIVMTPEGKNGWWRGGSYRVHILRMALRA